MSEAAPQGAQAASAPPSSAPSSAQTFTVAQACAFAKSLTDAVSVVLRGKEEVVELAVTTAIARGHLLLEDIPGVGKTTLAKTLGAALGLEMRRVQCTSDLLPSDVLGGSVYLPQTGALVFRPGPVFTKILLLDEINRASPRTQSALLEAMEERKVSIEGETRHLEEPFFVIATQNPVDSHGTYPLPESQLDRFLVSTALGYPAPEVELQLLKARRMDGAIAVQRVGGEGDLLAAQVAVFDVAIDDSVLGYLHAIIRATRESPYLRVGASTRAALSLERAVRARALVRGRTFVVPDDVKSLAVPVLGHRVVPKSAGVDSAGHSLAGQAIKKVLEDVIVPV